MKWSNSQQKKKNIKNFTHYEADNLNNYIPIEET